MEYYLCSDGAITELVVAVSLPGVYYMWSASHLSNMTAPGLCVKRTLTYLVMPSDLSGYYT